MVISDRNSGTPVPKKEPPEGRPRRRRRVSRPPGLPSPALCCACGLCILLAGLNITLVGAFAFSTLVPSANPPIVIGPVLLLVAFSFFGACCVCSRLPPPPHGSRGAKAGGQGGGLMGGGGGGGGLGGGAAFEIETSEHTLQDTTAVQLSPTSSPGSSRASSGPGKEAPDGGPASAEANGPSCVSGSAVYSAAAAGGGEVRLNLPREEVVT